MTAPAVYRTGVVDEGYVSPSSRAGGEGSWKARRRKSWRRTLFVLPLVLAAIALGVVVTSEMTELESPQLQARLSAYLEGAAVAVGLGIDQVTLSGHGHTAAQDVYAALALDSSRTFFDLDVKVAAQRIQQLPWVANAQITRIFPGQLSLHITERRAFALWQDGQTLHLIDEQGRVLGQTNARSAPDLPLVIGDRAPERAAELMSTLSGVPAVWTRFASAQRISGRRWRINLENGSRIELPSSGAKTVLEDVALRAMVDRFAGRPNHLMDLRAQGKFAVRRDEMLKARGQVPTSIEDVLRRGG